MDVPNQSLDNEGEGAEHLRVYALWLTHFECGAKQAQGGLGGFSKSVVFVVQILGERWEVGLQNII